MNTSKVESPNAATHEYYHRVRTELLPLIPRGAGTLLDVGCAAGATGAAAKAERGVAEVVGIEIEADVAEMARERIDRVYVGTAEEVLPTIADDKFDAVLCADVLEHMIDPWAFLTLLRPSLAPGGIVVASIPNVGHARVVAKILRNQFLYESEGILDRTHLRFFTQETIENMFVSTGYVVRSIEGRSTSRPAMQRVLARLPRGLARSFYGQYLVTAVAAD